MSRNLSLRNSSFKHFSIGHINAKRLTSSSHFSLIEEHVHSHKFEAIAITKTFFKEDDCDVTYALEGYNLFRNDRAGKEGGGVALYVTKSWTVKILIKSDPQYAKNLNT